MAAADLLALCERCWETCLFIDWFYLSLSHASLDYRRSTIDAFLWWNQPSWPLICRIHLGCSYSTRHMMDWSTLVSIDDVDVIKSNQTAANQNTGQPSSSSWLGPLWYFIFVLICFVVPFLFCVNISKCVHRDQPVRLSGMWKSKLKWVKIKRKGKGVCQSAVWSCCTVVVRIIIGRS